jgi:hypothetical protein
VLPEEGKEEDAVIQVRNMHGMTSATTSIMWDLQIVIPAVVPLIDCWIIPRYDRSLAYLSNALPAAAAH